MTIQEVIAQFNTTPFLFAGSGITRRYYNLPDWEGLLTIFAEKISQDAFIYRAYENRAKQETKNNDYMPLVASFIEKDFNKAWFDNIPGIRSDSELVLKSVSKGASPFKAEICHYISEQSQINKEYSEEISKLQRLSKNNIAGIITTNYDRFFEDTFSEYKSFVGQEELVFSEIQGIAEIYKIHGSVSDPNSIVINADDYQAFARKSKYLAAKLMTIFMEYPIIFIGYSISAPDVRNILKDIVECMPEDKMSLLQKRFVFISYDKNQSGAEVSSHSMIFDDKIIEMTRISLSDFGILFDALSKKKAAFPVKILRRFKEDLYKFALTNEPSETLRVAPLEDERIDENTLAITIGLAETGTYGLAQAVDSEKWYRNIVMHDLQYTSDQLLEYVYTELAKHNSWKLPVWYYLSTAKNKYEDIESKAPLSYSDIVSDYSIKKTRTTINSRTMNEIWYQEKKNLSRALRLLSGMPEINVNVNDLENILKVIFNKEPNCLSTFKQSDKSNIRKLIRIYDFLKYKNKKTS